MEKKEDGNKGVGTYYIIREHDFFLFDWFKVQFEKVLLRQVPILWEKVARSSYS